MTASYSHHLGATASLARDKAKIAGAFGGVDHQADYHDDDDNDGNDVDLEDDDDDHKLIIRQKVGLVAIWLLASFYGIATCFPEKVTNNDGQVCKR